MEKSIAKRQNENITDLSKEIALLNKLVAELEEKTQQPTLEFLKVRRWLAARGALGAGSAPAVPSRRG